MSKFVNSSIKAFGIGLLLLFGTLSFVDLNYGLIRFDWTPYKMFFSKEEKIGAWIDIERAPGSYANGLDKKWVHSIFRNLEVKVKWRESLTTDKLDMIYEIKSKLTNPIFAETKNRKVDYDVSILLKFIDEEGFVIESVRIPSSAYTHEKIERTSLYHTWSSPESEDVVIKGQKNDVVTKNMGKRIEKITFHPDIVINDWEAFKNLLNRY